VRKIDVSPKQIYWSESSELVTIACEAAFYILKYDKSIVTNFFASNGEPSEEGIEDAFQILHEIPERVRTGIWVGDCFIYTNANNRLNYCVGGEMVTISHLDRHMYLLGYIPRDNRLYLIDKSLNVVSYSLHLTVINYQTAVLRGDEEAATKILPSIPNDQRNRIAHFLDSQGLKEQALQVSLDPDHRFELAVHLGKLQVAHEIAKEAATEQKWKQLSDLALASCKFDLVEQCLWSAEDIGGLLLLYTSTGNADGIDKLAKVALEKGKNNVAFICFFLLRNLEACLNLLCDTGRIPEAAFLARTYLPSHVSRIVKMWKQDLKSVNEKAAESLADPMEYENLFPDIALALVAEKYFKQHSQKRPSAAVYSELKEDIFRNLIQEVKLLNIGEDHQELVGDLVKVNDVTTPPPTPISGIPQETEELDEDALEKALEEFGE